MATQNRAPNPDRKRCSARKSNGEPCKAWAIHGANVCRSHGGATPQVKAAAARRWAMTLAEREVRTLGLVPLDVSPSQALLDEVRWTATHVAWLRQKVQELHPEAQLAMGTDGLSLREGPHPLVFGVTRTEQGPEGYKTVNQAAPSVYYELYAREREHLVRVCAAALRAGIEERRVQLEEAMGYQIYQMLNTVLETLWTRVVGSGQPTRELWDAAVGEVVPRALRSLVDA